MSAGMMGGMYHGAAAQGAVPPIGGSGAAPSVMGDFGTALQGAAPWMMLFGAAQSAIGGFYAAKSQQTQLEMQAQNQRFAASMARINRRGAEFGAQSLDAAGQKQIGQYTMLAGAKRGSARTAFAARGGTVGDGSSGEVLGSMDVVKEIDRLSMNAANVRQREAARLQAFNIGIGATMADISASNLSASAGSIYPSMALGTSLMGSAAEIGNTLYRNRMLEEMVLAQSQKRF